MARLTRETVVAAALALVDAEGLAALSTRRLAAELGVSGPSLYHHFASKEEILGGIVASLYEQIRLTAEPPDWRGVLAEYAEQLRAQLVAHPAVVGLVLAAPLRSDPQLRVYDHVARTLTGSGIDRALARQIAFAADAVIFGALAMSEASSFDPDSEAGERYPALAEMASATLPSDEAIFATALGAFLAGLDAVVAGAAG